MEKNNLSEEPLLKTNELKGGEVIATYKEYPIRPNKKCGCLW